MSRNLLQAAGNSASAAESVMSTVLSAAQTNPVLAATALGVAAIGITGVFVYEEIQHYKKGKHEAEIHRILQFYKSSGLEALGIHPPFEFGGENDSLRAKRLEKEKTPDTALRDPIPLEQTNFRSIIDEALRGTESYIYDASHGDGTGMSIFVAKYVLNILKSEALRFEGREREIALTEALTDFINQYAHDENGKHTHSVFNF